MKSSAIHIHRKMIQKVKVFLKFQRSRLLRFGIGVIVLTEILSVSLCCRILYELTSNVIPDLNFQMYV